MGLQYFIYPKASHFLFNVTKCLKYVDWIHKDCVSQPWNNCILLCQAEFAYKNSVTTARILAYDFCYTNSSFKTERHIFSCIQLQVQVRTVCGFFFTICPFIVTFTLDSWKQHFPATSYSEFMSCISQAAAWTSARMESQLSVAFHCDPSAPENIWDRIQILGYWISGKVPLYWYQTRGVTWFSNGFLEVFWILLMWC